LLLVFVLLLLFNIIIMLFVCLCLGDLGLIGMRPNGDIGGDCIDGGDLDRADELLKFWL
jgi:hypothetical protein